MGKGPKAPPAAAERLRIDKWLWQARFLNSRSLAAEMVSEGAFRLNGQRIDKPGRGVGPGDVLTFALGAEVRVIRVLACGTRRGPVHEAATLYEDLAPRTAPRSGTAVPVEAADEDEAS